MKKLKTPFKQAQRMEVESGIHLSFHMKCKKRIFTSGNDAGIRQWLAWTEEKLLKGKKVPVAIKHDWYQTESHICVTVLAKNLNPDSVSVQFAPSTVSFPPKYCHNVVNHPLFFY